MRVSGFTFARNAVRLLYPLVESIRSVLPLVDEMVVNVGRSDDGTLELVRGIGDPRIVIVESTWDETSLERGRVLAEQTDIALARCTGDACLYLQADEVIHEDDHPRIRDSLLRMQDDRRVEGLIFDYVHFYGSFHTVGTSRVWYRQEVRAFRSGLGVGSWKDAQGFRIWAPPPGFTGERPRSLKTGDPARKLQVARSGARVFHYGWVRPPERQEEKLAEFARLYHGADAGRGPVGRSFSYDVEEKVRRFEGTHPAVMAARVAELDWPFEPRARLLRPGHIREDLLDILEGATGYWMGEYSNFELVR